MSKETMLERKEIYRCFNTASLEIQEVKQFFKNAVDIKNSLEKKYIITIITDDSEKVKKLLNEITEYKLSYIYSMHYLVIKETKKIK